MRRLLAALPFAVLPLALFAALFDVATLDIGNAGWLIRGTDNGGNALGLHAYLHDPAAGLSLRTTLLDAPEGVPLLFTDSNPLIGLLAKPAAAWLPADAQFVGPWLLLCLILQVLFAWLLLRRFAPGRLALWGGVALMSALPTLFNRFVHANLFAHWLILAGLWIYVERRGLRWWAPLIAVTALVHSYLLVMVGAIWASAMVERVATARGRDRLAAGVQPAAILVLVGLLAWWLGAGGHYALAGNYGAFAMPLDALINPGNPSYSTLLPAIAQREGREFEGFQYLGAGLLALAAIAAVFARGRPAPAEEQNLHLRLRWLVPALVVLTLLAISNYPDLAGHRLPRVPLPAALAPALDLVRASGRLFWPVAYTGVFVAIVAVYRLGAHRAGLFLTAAVALQVVDLAGMAIAIHADNALARDHRLYVRTTDPRWQTAVAAARDVAFEPAVPTRDLALFQEVAWRAASLGRPVRTVHAARTPLASTMRAARDHADFVRGMLVPDRLYVLLPGAVMPPATRARAVTLDGVRVILPLAALRPASPRSAS